MVRALVTIALVPFLAAAPSAAIAGVQGRPAAALAGTWINPRGSVKVETGDCAGRLCGWVRWANAEAVQDARDAGVRALVGTELLEGYKRTSPTSWTGRVFVPDMGRTFYSRITQLDPNALRISGCILGGLVCKSQVWHRARM